MPAAAVTPAPKAYSNVAAVKKLVVGFDWCDFTLDHVGIMDIQGFVPRTEKSQCRGLVNSSRLGGTSAMIVVGAARGRKLLRVCGHLFILL